jgi:YidC/Oxa1 family membrane protein insertase
MAIRKKYAGRDDNPTKQKMTQEIQDLYQKEGYNPMGGCLPLLIQMPILLALYNIVMNPLKYICQLGTDTIERLASIAKAATGVNYDLERNINLLSDIKNMDFSNFAGVEGFSQEVYDNLPNLKLFGGAIDLGAMPSLTNINWLLIVPVLTFVTYFLSMKLTRKLTYQPQADDKATGCSNNMMDIMMPLFSVYIAFVVPAAIGVYWIFKSVLGTVKQVALKYAMPLPKFTEEDFKAAEKEMAVKQTQAPKEKSGKVVRSLHHIDDEDYEDTREAGRRRREALEAQEAEALAAAEKKANVKIPGLKSDDRPQRNKKKLEQKQKEKGEKNDQPAQKDNNTTDGE